MSALPLPDQEGELIEVFDTQQESEALVVKGMLESAGIESVITGLDSPQDVLPGVGGVIVRVSPENAEEAKGVVEQYRNNTAPTADEES